MVFSDIDFLFFFLPCVLAGYYIIRKNRKYSNLFLTAASLLFYAWGEPVFVFVMMASIVVNWQFGLWVDRARRNSANEKPVLTLMCVFNLGMLGVFKYLNFVLENLNWAFRLNLPQTHIALPIGISFFTFQAMSYVLDVHRRKGQVQKNLFNVALYIAFFPQLIAGPIVRYQTVAEEIEDRRETLEDFTAGVRRFMVGLCKKVILANNLGLLANAAFGLAPEYASVGGAWMGAVAHVLQTYFDFSGYSDMAIGLGRMFGFHFLENFRYPMVSKSITGFWKRWHISMGSWFQDYLYFPLGGSRVSKPRIVFNIFVVWFLTGLWHGAAWTYVLWGCTYFVLLIFERFTGVGKWMEKHAIGHGYAMLLIVVVSVMIKTNDFATAWAHYAAMFGAGASDLWNNVATVFVREYGWFLLAGCVLSLPVKEWLLKRAHVPEKPLDVVCAVLLGLCTAVAVCYVAVGSYNPFIYYNF